MNSSASENEIYPACGLQVDRPLKIRVLQYASLVLAVAGLILLYLFAVNRDLPFVRIGDITPAMNFAYVRISGEVTRDAYVFQSGGIVFDLKDGSGEIAVMGGKAQAQALEAAGKLPRRGDRIEVAGSLSVAADQEPRLRIQSADQLVLNRKRAAAASSPAPRIRLADVTAAHKGEQISVSGILKIIDVPGPGSRAPYTLTLEENGAELAVVFWEDVFRDLEDRLPLPGKRLSVRGGVDVYKDTVQLKVRSAGDLRIAESGQ
ncbi:MAG TPA: OB-fold nucleic acid binding domain-containing protein [Pontiellaceae bacterium]|nr:OB-fold nucleic acid binding domain-containing protein [Pontiellaceae bacterium]